MLFSQFDVDAETLTRIAAPLAPTMVPGANENALSNAAVILTFHRIVAAGDSIVTRAAASPDTWMPEQK
jgi:hypothetical protein